jgi:hypothetical protein
LRESASVGAYRGGRKKKLNASIEPIATATAKPRPQAIATGSTAAM